LYRQKAHALASVATCCSEFRTARYDAPVFFEELAMILPPRRYQARPWTPTPEQQEYLRATRATSEFLHHLPAEIREQYAGQWIAAKDRQVVATAPTRSELNQVLRDCGDDPLVLVIRLEKGMTIRWRRPL
jgi:hypothetical protein